MSDGSEKQIPKRSKGDNAHSLAKAGLSAIPMVGGAAAELFQNLVQPPLERRRQEWMEYVGEELKRLEAKGMDLERLQNDDRFISTVMQASQIAISTHEKLKREALRNTVINVAQGQAPDEAMEHMFLQWIGTLAPLHIQILSVFQAPEPPGKRNMGGLSSVLESHFPELRGRREFYDQVWADLYSRGLVNTNGLHTTMSGSGLASKRTTTLGDEFLRFISHPEVEKL